jgi:hypothetical protein
VVFHSDTCIDAKVTYVRCCAKGLDNGYGAAIRSVFAGCSQRHATLVRSFHHRVLGPTDSSDIRRSLQTRAGTTPGVRFTLYRICRVNNHLVLLEAPFDPLRRQMNSVLLTVDLTKAVADEAIERKDSVVIAYRELPRKVI